MTKAFVFAVPVKRGLKLMAIVSSNVADAEGESCDAMVDEGNGVGLGVTLIDFKSSDARCIVAGRGLVTLDRFVVFVLEGQKLNINLNVMARNLLLISDGMDFAQPGSSRQSA